MTYRITNTGLWVTIDGKSYNIPSTEPSKLLKIEDIYKLESIELLKLASAFGGLQTNPKNYLLAQIKFYDLSPEVNSFIYKGIPMWLDKNTRVGLMNLANYSKDTIKIFLNDTEIEFNLDFFKEFLKNLELYAYECYMTTQKHISAVSNLTSLEEIENYNFKTGYPEKLNIE